MGRVDGEELGFLLGMVVEGTKEGDSVGFGVNDPLSVVEGLRDGTANEIFDNVGNNDGNVDVVNSRDDGLEVGLTVPKNGV